LQITESKKVCFLPSENAKAPRVQTARKRDISGRRAASGIGKCAEEPKSGKAPDLFQIFQRAGGEPSDRDVRKWKVSEKKSS
jgi:hypothetical protein